ncbi:uncharacterized protein [Rutidosis leptorrhynchoides]|uniref:uncharacterized protein n=1 Tax=Rutidosis leptorrhynchoides TaxID=125765 RepID=UPI003A991EBF
MLADSSLHVHFWGEAVANAYYTMNRVLIVKCLGKTCYELLHGRKPTLKHLEPFGAPCTILKRKPGTKFDAKVVAGVFLGNSSPNKRVFNNETRCVEEWSEVDVQRNQQKATPRSHPWIYNYDELIDSFNLAPNYVENELELQMLFDLQNVPVVSAPIQSLDPTPYVVESLQESDQDPIYDTCGSDISSESSENPEDMVPKTTAAHHRENIIGDPNKYVRTRRQVQFDGQVDTHMTTAAAFFEYACHISKIEPKTTKEALKHVDWVMAMQEEIQ